MLLQNKRAKKNIILMKGTSENTNEKNVGEKSFLLTLEVFMTSAKNLENCEEELSAGTS